MNNEPTPPPPWNPETCIVRRGDWLCISESTATDPWAAPGRRVRISDISSYRLSGAMVLLGISGGDGSALDVIIYLPVTGELTAPVLGTRVMQRLDELLGADVAPVEKTVTAFLSKSERDLMLDDILALLAEAGVPTPEETYKADGGWSLALADIRRALADLKGLQDWWNYNPSLLQRQLKDAHEALEKSQQENTALREWLLPVLRRANDLCRSMHAITEREGKETNWPPFRAELEGALAEQHELLNQVKA